MIGEFYTPIEVLGLMKTIHCLDLDEFKEAVVQPWGEPPENIREQHHNMRHNLFGWISNKCTQDQLQIFQYAERKQIMYELTKVKT